MATLAPTAAVEPRTFEDVPAGKIAIWWFLASEIMTFGGLIASYIVMRLGSDGWAEATAHLNVTLAAVNTVVLLTSSYTVVQAFVALERGDERRFRVHMALTILAGVAFLGIKAVEYTGEITHGYTPGAGIFWSFYYGMTGLHALHVIGGMVLNTVLLLAARLRTARRVEIAGLYWHFVDIVWIFLFPLVYLS
jgi:heme/copper-type cytochrome/quinol oxidase subunit 3